MTFLRRLSNLSGLLFVLILLSSDELHGQVDPRQAILDELAEDYLPGLLGTYKDSLGNSFTRIDRRLSFDWKGQTADSRLKSTEFEATWEGLLFFQSVGQYQLYLDSDGKVEVEFGGHSYSESRGPLGLVETGSIEMQFGWHPIRIRYQSPQQPEATGKSQPEGKIKLYWQGPSFKLEPVGAQFLFHATPETIQDHYKRGEELAHALRCARCHQTPAVQDSLGPAPSLQHFRDYIQPDWLTQRLQETEVNQAATQSSNHSQRMPSYGFSREEAQALTAFLFQNSKNPKPGGELLEQGDVEAGKQIFASVGCIACHQADSLGEPGLFDGGQLKEISLKRKDDFWLQWFKDPSLVNPHHRMPQVELSKEEEANVIAYLKSLEPPRSTLVFDEYVFNEELGAKGKRLYEVSGCANCHEAKPAEKKLPLTFDHVAGCLESADRSLNRPGYTLTEMDARALQEFFTKVKSSNSDTTQALLVKQNNCFQCHARNELPGIAGQLDQITASVSELDALKPALTPPSLNGVGDKLNDQALVSAISRKESARRPWLHVRMPQFGFADTKMRELVDWFVEKDRVPDAFIQLHASIDSTPVGELPELEELHQAGSRLVTTDGFGCTSCHQVGSVIPPKAPLNAKGPDLSMLNTRIRKVWFNRWVSNPARIVPRMEMPSVQLAVRGVLDNHLPSQLEAIWETLNKADFEPPTPGAIRIARQSGIAGADPGVKMITDVVYHRDVQYIKPALIGLRNRHNLLFDMEAGTFLGWWQGDIARQRTKGKVWLWETAGESWSGLPLGNDYRGVPDIQLMSSQGKLVEPRSIGQFKTSLDRWTQLDDGLQIEQRYQFEIDGVTHWVHVTQILQEIWSGDLESARAGIERTINFAGIPEGYQAMIGLAPASLELREDEEQGRSMLAVAGQHGNRWLQTTGSPVQVQQAYYAVIADQPQVTLQFLSNLEVDRFPLLDVEITPPAPTDLKVVPGVTSTRLPFFDEFMPTGIQWDEDGTLWITSLKGRVWRAVDTDKDGMEDRLHAGLHELAAPYGVQPGKDFIDVVNKYALLRLFDRDRDGVYEQVQTVAAGWGHTADYHDWTVGPVSDGKGGYYITTACQQDDRSVAAAKWRGRILHLKPRKPTKDNPYLFDVEVHTSGHRFPMGLARNSAGQLFVSDNQGNYNPYNEINYVLPGKHYGFINKLERMGDTRPALTPPAIDMPHPWTRSVNGICFLETPQAARNFHGRNLFGPFEGHLVGCEYDTRRLIRMSFQQVGKTIQGAAYPLTLDQPDGGEPLLGPLAVAVSPRGELYVASIRDSGWGGANNIGTLAKLDFARSELPPGIAEVTVQSSGFRISFTAPVDAARAALLENYSIQSATRVSTTSYGGADRERRTDRITSVEVANDRMSVVLKVEALRVGFVYDIRLRNLTADGGVFFPAEAYYTLRTIPAE